MASTRFMHLAIETLRTAVALATLVAVLAAPAHAINTSFTYQGQLKKNGTPYTGTATFNFFLYDAPSGGALVGNWSPVVLTVANGLFSTDIDFGSAFDGNPRWLEVQASTSGEGFTSLLPRQEIKAIPYSQRATFAESGGTGSSQWVSDPGGIHYVAGNVAIGQAADANLDRQFIVNAGTAAATPGWFKNNNVNYAALVLQNDAVDGVGLADSWSDQHYLTGRLGVGTIDTSPAQFTVVPAAGTATGIKSKGYPNVVTGVSAGVWGIGDGSIFSGACAGVRGESDWGNGVEGTTSHVDSYAGYFKNTAGGTALFVDGFAKVKTLQILGGADIVEGFDTRTDAAREPGTVVVIDEKRTGQLRESDAPYDRKVAGVVSGAGGIEAGIRLGHEGRLSGETPVAMTGRVYVKCSTENGAIRPGDLLTTSATSGHAMRVTDHDLAGGAVIGKAMSSLDARTGLVLVLVNLQ